MKSFFTVRILALTIALLLAALPVVAVERPFALNGRGVATFITDGAGNVVGANISDSGTATHLGLWTAVGTVNFSPDPDNPGRILSSGTGTITAANGDKIQIEFNGSLDPVAGVDRGVIRFVGGTGRFATASGSVDAVVTLNPLTGGFEITAVGSIDY